MPDKDEPGEDVNLEMPSLGLGGWRRRRRKDAGEPAPGPAEPEAPEASAQDVPPVEPFAPELDAGDARPAAEPDPTPVEPVESRAIDPDDDPLTILDEPAYDEPIVTEEPTVTDATSPAGSVGAEDTAVLPGQGSPSRFADEPATQPQQEDDRGGGLTSPGGRPGHRDDDGGGLALPAIPAMTAAMITGVVVGLLAVGATYLGLQGCEAIRGTSSCGGPGLFLLIAIMVGLVVVGGLLLRAWGVSDPMSTSFLGVGLVAVVALLFLVDVIFSPWMLLVIPVIALCTFALSHWVTVAFIEPADDGRELHDVE